MSISKRLQQALCSMWHIATPKTLPPFQIVLLHSTNRVVYGAGMARETVFALARQRPFQVKIKPI